MKILILGVSGMLGHTLFTELFQCSRFEVYGTVRNIKGIADKFPQLLLERVRDGVDVDNFDTVIRAMAAIQPDMVINCIGLIKQLPLANDFLSAINVNARLPHRISLICRTAKARFIHISTDCVFNGFKGNYTEDDPSDALDLYGKTKYLGEVRYPPHCITLRTSIIGHELSRNYGLVEWFLDQKDKVRGFTKAIFTGFPTIEIANIIQNYVISNPNLHGLYHVSADPISKYELLKLIAQEYGKSIEIEPDDDFYCDRSLNSSRFREATGYYPPSWAELVQKMHQNYLGNPYLQ